MSGQGEDELGQRYLVTPLLRAFPGSPLPGSESICVIWFVIWTSCVTPFPTSSGKVKAIHEEQFHGVTNKYEVWGGVEYHAQVIPCSHYDGGQTARIEVVDFSIFFK